MPISLDLKRFEPRKIRGTSGRFQACIGLKSQTTKAPPSSLDLKVSKRQRHSAGSMNEVQFLEFCAFLRSCFRDSIAAESARSPLATTFERIELWYYGTMVLWYVPKFWYAGKTTSCSKIWPIELPLKLEQKCHGKPFRGLRQMANNKFRFFTKIRVLELARFEQRPGSSLASTFGLFLYVSSSLKSRVWIHLNSEFEIRFN